MWIIFKSLTRRRLEIKRNDLLRELEDLTIEMKSVNIRLDPKEYCHLSVEAGDLRLQIRLLTEILDK
jgi:hypothetical protein